MGNVSLQSTNAEKPPDRLSRGILLVDDNAAVRAGLRNLISSRAGWFICGEAANGEQAVSLALQMNPSAIVMDISMPGMDGLEATRRIREQLPSAEIVIVSQHDSEHVVFEAQRAGARGFVVKSHLSADLLPAIEAALLHSSRISAPVSKAWQSAISTAKQPEKAVFTDPGPHDDLDLMSGGGEMGARMRTHDWSKTPFGPVSKWPQSLRTALRICLDSRFPILIWWGPELRLLYNDAYLPALGTTKYPQALGARGEDVWSDIWDTIGPLLESVGRTGQATWESDQLLLFDRNGYVEESYWTYSYSAIRLASGEVGGIFSAVHEVTDRVLGARRLKTLREVADQVVQAKNELDACHLAMQSIMLNPADCPYAMISICEGMKATRVAASFDARRHIPTSFDLSREDVWGIQMVMQTRTAQVVQVAHPQNLPRAPYGDPCAQAISLPILGTAREPIAVLTIGISPYRALDVAYRDFLDSLARNLAANINNARAYDEERKRAEALAELDRAKTVFFSNVSHEFRTPLTLMLGPLEDVLAAQDQLPAEHRERLQVAHRNSIRLLRLVNTLLDFSRIEAGRIQASYEPTDLAKLTVELASVFRSATERAGLRLVIHCPPIDEPVYVDHEMWEKIVFNLLSNAFKFTFDGEIEVSLHKSGDAVELSVRDTGTGIPAGELPRLFERFYRVKNAQGRTFEGSGIGLSLVQELAKLHGGTVKVESQLKRGSTFTVSIPLGKNHLPAERIGAVRTLESTSLRGEIYVQEALRWLPGAEANSDDTEVATVLSPGETPPRVARNPDTRARVLLADDNADMRDYVRRLLSEQYEVEAVADGETALNNARQRCPDLILSDIMMPRLDGFGLLNAVRSDEALKSVPVILLSARAGEESRIEGMQSGADDYLAKPFSARELLARVRTHLELARARKRSEEALRESQSRLALALEASRTALFDWDIVSARGYWNPQMASIYDFNPKHDYITAEEWRSLFHPEDVDRLTREAEQVFKHQEAFHFEFRAVRPGGEIRWILSHGRVVRDAGGRSLRLIGIHTDITDRKRVEEALQQRQIELTEAQRLAKIGSWHWTPKTDTVLWSEELYRIAGRDPKSPAVSYDEHSRLYTPESWTRLQAAVKAALEDGTPYSIELELVRPNGETRWVNSTGEALRDSSGTVVALRGTLQDITDRREAQQATHLLAAIVDSSDDAIVSKDLNGFITSWNRSAERIFGYTAREAVGQHITLIIPENRHGEEAEILARLRRGERIDHFDTVRARKDGTLLNISLTVSPVRDAAGRVVGASKVARDITLQKQAEERERQLSAEAVAATAKFKAVFEQTTVFAGIMSKDGVIIEANRMCLEACGYRSEEVLGLRFWETGWWRNFPACQNKIRAATPLAARGIPYRETLPYSWADGTERLMDFALYPIVDEQGKVLFLHPTGVDITDLKRAEENARKLAETLEAEVRARTRELENRNAEVLRQSELLRAFSQRLLRTQDEERRHIARELHDSAGQTLTVLGMNLAQLIQKAGRKAPELASDAEEIQETVQQLHREIRTTSYLLHPPLLDESGLSSALNWYVQGLVERSDLEIHLEIPDDFGRLPREMELVVFRMVQECLTNIHRHSGSKEASIRIARDADTITVDVRDRGKGMSPEKLSEIQVRGSGLGIRGMRERLRQFEGKLDIESNGSGTRVLVTIPIPNSEVPEESAGNEPLQAVR